MNDILVDKFSGHQVHAYTQTTVLLQPFKILIVTGTKKVPECCMQPLHAKKEEKKNQQKFCINLLRLTEQ